MKRHEQSRTPTDPSGPESICNAADFVLQLDRLRRSGTDEHRRRVGLDELARITKIPRSSVHSYLSGVALPPADRLDLLVLALGCTKEGAREWAQARERVAELEWLNRSLPPGGELFQLPTIAAQARRERTTALARRPEIDPTPQYGPGPTVVKAYVCSTQVGTYIYRDPDAASSRTGYLHAGNNWFICQARGPLNPDLGLNVVCDLWLYTQADVPHDGAGGWGWAPVAALAGFEAGAALPGIRWWQEPDNRREWDCPEAAPRLTAEGR